MRSLGKRVCLVLGAVAVTVAVLPPPISTIANELFAAHMMQHLLLIAVAAPLLAASRNNPISLPPVWAWLAFVATFLFWHWSVAFRWAAGSAGGELLELSSILVTAFLVLERGVRDGEAEPWRARAVRDDGRRRHRPSGRDWAWCSHTASSICTMPGENAPAWGITPLQDQQIAGMLMWVPANLIFFAIATWLFARWMAAPDQHHSVTA